MHGPRSVWVKHSKSHNKGRAINLLRPSECRMAGEVLQFLRVFRLKATLQACTRDPVFVDYKKFGFLADIFNSTQFWKCLFAIIQALYPVYRILRIADTMVGGMDKLYYYVTQTDRLLEPGMKNVMRMFYDSKMPHMELSKLKLTKADREWLKRKSLFSISLLTHTAYQTNKPIHMSLSKSSIKRIRWIDSQRISQRRQCWRVRMGRSRRRSL
jgi:hypothetical protein